MAAAKKVTFSQDRRIRQLQAQLIAARKAHAYMAKGLFEDGSKPRAVPGLARPIGPAKLNPGYRPGVTKKRAGY